MSTDRTAGATLGAVFWQIINGLGALAYVLTALAVAVAVVVLAAYAI